MPDSDLLNLAAQVKSMQQNPTVSADVSNAPDAPVPSVAPQMPKPNPIMAAAGPYQLPTVRGDDALAQAWSFSQLTPDEKAAAKLYFDSKGMVQSQMQQDPAYAEKFLSGLKGLKGSAATDYVVNQGDQLKLAKLKQLEPNNYNSEEAAKAGFLNSATFGQLSRIMGVADHFVNGTPVSEAIDQQAEKLRLLKSAYPNASWTGEVASYLMPGSPVKYAFEKAASVGAGTVAKLLGRVASNPGLLGKIAEAVGAGGAGSAAVGGIEGTAGTGNQQLSLDRGLKTSLAQGAAGAATAGVLSGIGNSIAPAVAGTLRGMNKGLAAALEQSTGTSVEAMRAYNANPEAIRAAANQQFEIGQNLSHFLMDKNASQLPERIQADNLLDRFPSVDAKKTIDFLKSFQKSANPAQDSPVAYLNEFGKRLENQLPVDSAAQQTGLDSIARKRAILNSTIDIRTKALEKQAADQAQSLSDSISRKRAIISASNEANASQISKQVAKQTNPWAYGSGNPSDLLQQKTSGMVKAGADQVDALNADETSGHQSIADMLRQGRDKIAKYAQSQNSQFDAAEQALRNNAPRSTMVPAAAMRDFVDTLQGAARDSGAYGKYSDFMGTQLERAASIALNSVSDTANGMIQGGIAPGADDATAELGQVGKNYLDLMQKTREKRDLLGFMTSQLGSGPDAIQKNSEGFVRNLFGPNKELVRAKLAALDDKFGTNFLELAQNTQYAKQLGPDGTPQPLPTHRTGASVMGTLIAGAGGGILGMLGGQLVGGAGSEIAAGIGGAKAGEALGAAFSSPKVATSLIGASDKITKFADVMTSNPDVLQRIATSREYPSVVKGIASRLLGTFYKDGPLSASSSLRLVADTPYFVGLVHAFDLTQQKMQSNERYNAVKKTQRQ